MTGLNSEFYAKQVGMKCLGPELVGLMGPMQ